METTEHIIDDQVDSQIDDGLAAAEDNSKYLDQLIEVSKFFMGKVNLYKITRDDGTISIVLHEPDEIHASDNRINSHELSDLLDDASTQFSDIETAKRIKKAFDFFEKKGLSPEEFRDFINFRASQHGKPVDPNYAQWHFIPLVLDTNQQEMISHLGNTELYGVLNIHTLEEQKNIIDNEEPVTFRYIYDGDGNVIAQNTAAAIYKPSLSYSIKLYDSTIAPDLDRVKKMREQRDNLRVEFH